MERDSLCCLSGLLNFNQAEKDSACRTLPSWYAVSSVQRGEDAPTGCVFALLLSCRVFLRLAHPAVLNPSLHRDWEIKLMYVICTPELADSQSSV